MTNKSSRCYGSVTQKKWRIMIYPHLPRWYVTLSPRIRNLFPKHMSLRVCALLWSMAKQAEDARLVCTESGYVMACVIGINHMIWCLVVGEYSSGETLGEWLWSQTYRATKDWVRTVIVGVDGGIFFAIVNNPFLPSSMTVWCLPIHPLKRVRPTCGLRDRKTIWNNWL